MRFSADTPHSGGKPASWRALVAAAFACVFLSVLAGNAGAASPVDQYLASRDRYIATLNKQFEEMAKQDGDAKAYDVVGKAEKAALSDLEGQLRGLIGQVTLPGFSSEGTVNLGTLFDGEMEFGRLDGLVYNAKSGDGQALVSTRALVQSWLRGHREWWGDQPSSGNVPQDLDNALRSEAFYTQALSTDAAVTKYAEIPLTISGEGVSAHAMLNGRQQDDGPFLPNEIIVSVVVGDKVFILTEPVTAKIQKIKACDQVWDRYRKKAGIATGEGDKAYRKCFEDRFKALPAFAIVARQAQALAERAVAK